MARRVVSLPDEIASLSAQSGHDRIGRTAGIGRE
jgi:hypothetical protein